MEHKIEEAKTALVGGGTIERMKDLFIRYHDIFRVEFAVDPPVKVEPLKVRLKEGSVPIMAKSRRYPPLHRDHIDRHLSDLMEHDLVYRNPDSRWGNAPRIVGKKRVGDYRMTVDLRAINAVTIPMAWPMPHLEVVMANLEGSRCYFSLDCFRFYWKPPLDEGSRDSSLW